MRLRTQLLLVSLATLALPWAGCQYAREFESALRQNQSNALADSAGSIAAVLSERPGLLVRDTVQLVSSDNPDDAVYAIQLPSFVTLDGFVGDWDLGPEPLRPLVGLVDARYVAGIDKADIWLYLQVADDDLLYEQPGSDNFDRILIDYEDPGGVSQQLMIATSAVGRLSVRRRSDNDWVSEPAAQAVWDATQTGYRVEVRLRNRLVGARLGVSVLDQKSDGGIVSSSSFSSARAGNLLHPLANLEEFLAGYRFANRRLIVVNRDGWLIGSVGDTRAQSNRSANYPVLEKLIRRMVSPHQNTEAMAEGRRARFDSAEVNAALQGTADQRWYNTPNDRTALVVAAHPIRNNGAVLGAVILEQSSDAILTLTDRALTRLLSLTLFATLAAAIALVGFATYLSLRIRRLSRSAERAMSPEGAIATQMPDAERHDELGDLSRSFTGLLSRLREHTEYLRSLASKLSHELRTPLAVVQSSLDNLEAGTLDSDVAVYAARAREGSQRLRSILTAMSEATRVEQSIEHSELEVFDLAALVRGCVGGYQDIHTDRVFQLQTPTYPCRICGAPELLAQMLDKLVDNAVDFSPAQGQIVVRLSAEGSNYRLGIANDGPLLPEKMRDQLFDSMVSLRSKKGESPHLGFGLHIARLIVDFHQGNIGCHNLAEGTGVEFFVLVPAVGDPTP